MKRIVLRKWSKSRTDPNGFWSAVVKPFYRSRLFWLGLVPAFFLAWMWGSARSTAHTISYWASDDCNLTALHAPWGIILGRQKWHDGTSFWSSTRFSFRVSDANTPTWQTLPEHFPQGSIGYKHVRSDRKGTQYIRVGFPILFFGYLAIWFSTTCWWQLRKRRKAPTAN